MIALEVSTYLVINMVVHQHKCLISFLILERIIATSSEGLEILFLIIGLGLYIYLFILYCTGGDKKNNRFGKNIYVKIKKKKQ